MWGRTFDSTEYPMSNNQNYPRYIRNGGAWLGGDGQNGYSVNGQRYRLVNNGQDWVLDHRKIEHGNDWLTRQDSVAPNEDYDETATEDEDMGEQQQQQQQAESQVQNGAYNLEDGVQNGANQQYIDDEGFNRILDRANGWNIFRRYPRVRKMPSYQDVNRDFRPKFDDAFDRFVREADPANAGASSAEQYVRRMGTGNGMSNVVGNNANAWGAANTNGAGFFGNVANAGSGGANGMANGAGYGNSYNSNTGGYSPSSSGPGGYASSSGRGAGSSGSYGAGPGYGAGNSGYGGNGGSPTGGNPGNRGYAGNPTGGNPANRGYGGNPTGGNPGNRGYGGNPSGGNPGNRGYGGNPAGSSPGGRGEWAVM
jgi:hypothetical protein